MKTLKQILLAFTFSVAFAQFAFAGPLPMQFYASTFEANVGDTVTFTLKVNPEAGKPAYTVGATLKYDPKIVSFIDASVDKAWMPLSKSPYELTDTTNGVVTRTAGYPEGLKTVANFTTYSFRATTPGETKITIGEGMSLDAESNDSGIQSKVIKLTVRGATEPAEAPTTSTTQTQKAEPAKKNVQQTIVLDVQGQTAMYSDEDYTFNVVHSLKVEQPTTGTTSVSVYDQNGAEAFVTSKNFDNSTTTTLSFTIPANSLVAGNYSLVVTTKHSDQKTPLSVTKDLGVLSKSEKTIEKAVNVPYIPLYVYAIFGILVIIIFFMWLHKRSKKFRNFLKNF